LSWLHFDDLVEYEDPELGYSLAYSAPHIKATIYVYPVLERSSEPADYLDELEKARRGIVLAHGEKAIEHDWGVRDMNGHALYSFIPAYEPSELSFLMVSRRQGYFIKIRCSFVDEPLLREVSNDFLESYLKAHISPGMMPK
jgi:hypothetical protein